MQDPQWYPDTVSLIKRDGTRVDNIRARVAREGISTANDEHPVDDGDEIQHTRPGGRIDRFRVVGDSYRPAMPGFVARYYIKYETIDDQPRNEVAVSSVYDLTGPNARVSDQSVRVVYATTSELFEQLRVAIARGIQAEAKRDDSNRRVCETENCVGR